MLLQRIIENLKLIERGSLKSIADSLAIDPDALRGMLELLIAKGRVRRVETHSACGSCTKCDPSENEIYEWAGS